VPGYWWQLRQQNLLAITKYSRGLLEHPLKSGLCSWEKIRHSNETKKEMISASRICFDDDEDE